MNKFIRTISKKLCRLLTIALVLTGVPVELFAQTPPSCPVGGAFDINYCKNTYCQCAHKDNASIVNCQQSCGLPQYETDVDAFEAFDQISVSDLLNNKIVDALTNYGTNFQLVVDKATSFMSAINWTLDQIALAEANMLGTSVYQGSATTAGIINQAYQTVAQKCASNSDCINMPYGKSDYDLYCTEGICATNIGAACQTSKDCLQNDKITPNPDLACDQNSGVCVLNNAGANCSTALGTMDATNCGLTGGLTCQLWPEDGKTTVCTLVPTNYPKNKDGNGNWIIPPNNPLPVLNCMQTDTCHGLGLDTYTLNSNTTPFTAIPSILIKNANYSADYYQYISATEAPPPAGTGGINYLNSNNVSLITAANVPTIYALTQEIKVNVQIAPNCAGSISTCAVTGGTPPACCDISGTLSCQIISNPQDGLFNQFSVICSETNPDESVNTQALLNAIEESELYLNPTWPGLVIGGTTPGTYDYNYALVQGSGQPSDATSNGGPIYGFMINPSNASETTGSGNIANPPVTIGITCLFSESNLSLGISCPDNTNDYITCSTSGTNFNLTQIVGSCIGASCLNTTTNTADGTMCCNGTVCCENAAACGTNINTCIYSVPSNACTGTAESLNCIIADGLYGQPACFGGACGQTSDCTVSTDPTTPYNASDLICLNGQCVLQCKTNENCSVIYPKELGLSYTCQNSYCDIPTGAATGTCQPQGSPGLFNSDPTNGALYNLICANIYNTTITAFNEIFNHDLTVGQTYASAIGDLLTIKAATDYVNKLKYTGNTCCDKNGNLVNCRSNDKTVINCEPITKIGPSTTIGEALKGAEPTTLQAYLAELQEELMLILSNQSSPLDPIINGKDANGNYINPNYQAYFTAVKNGDMDGQKTYYERLLPAPWGKAISMLKINPTTKEPEICTDTTDASCSSTPLPAYQAISTAYNKLTTDLADSIQLQKTDFPALLNSIYCPTTLNCITFPSATPNAATALYQFYTDIQTAKGTKTETDFGTFLQQTATQNNTGANIATVMADYQALINNLRNNTKLTAAFATLWAMVFTGDTSSPQLTNLQNAYQQLIIDSQSITVKTTTLNVDLLTLIQAMQLYINDIPQGNQTFQQSNLASDYNTLVGDIQNKYSSSYIAKQLSAVLNDIYQTTTTACVAPVAPATTFTGPLPCQAYYSLINDIQTPANSATLNTDIAAILNIPFQQAKVDLNAQYQTVLTDVNSKSANLAADTLNLIHLAFGETDTKADNTVAPLYQALITDIQSVPNVSQKDDLDAVFKAITTLSDNITLGDLFTALTTIPTSGQQATMENLFTAMTTILPQTGALSPILLADFITELTTIVPQSTVPLIQQQLFISLFSALSTVPKGQRWPEQMTAYITAQLNSLTTSLAALISSINSSPITNLNTTLPTLLAYLFNPQVTPANLAIVETAYSNLANAIKANNSSIPTLTTALIAALLATTNVTSAEIPAALVTAIQQLITDAVGTTLVATTLNTDLDNLLVNFNPTNASVIANYYQLLTSSVATTTANIAPYTNVATKALITPIQLTNLETSLSNLINHINTNGFTQLSTDIPNFLTYLFNPLATAAEITNVQTAYTSLVAGINGSSAASLMVSLLAKLTANTELNILSSALKQLIIDTTQVTPIAATLNTDLNNILTSFNSTNQNAITSAYQSLADSAAVASTNLVPYKNLTAAQLTNMETNLDALINSINLPPSFAGLNTDIPTCLSYLFNPLATTANITATQTAYTNLTASIKNNIPAQIQTDLASLMLTLTTATEPVTLMTAIQQLATDALATKPVSATLNTDLANLLANFNPTNQVAIENTYAQLVNGAAIATQNLAPYAGLTAAQLINLQTNLAQVINDINGQNYGSLNYPYLPKMLAYLFNPLATLAELTTVSTAYGKLVAGINTSGETPTEIAALAATLMGSLTTNHQLTLDLTNAIIQLAKDALATKPVSATLNTDLVNILNNFNPTNQIKIATIYQQTLESAAIATANLALYYNNPNAANNKIPGTPSDRQLAMVENKIENVIYAVQTNNLINLNKYLPVMLTYLFNPIPNNSALDNIELAYTTLITGITIPATTTFINKLTTVTQTGTMISAIQQLITDAQSANPGSAALYADLLNLFTNFNPSEDIATPYNKMVTDINAYTATAKALNTDLLNLFTYLAHLALAASADQIKTDFNQLVSDLGQTAQTGDMNRLMTDIFGATQPAQLATALQTLILDVLSEQTSTQLNTDLNALLSVDITQAIQNITTAYTAVAAAAANPANTTAAALTKLLTDIYGNATVSAELSAAYNTIIEDIASGATSAILFADLSKLLQQLTPTAVTNHLAINTEALAVVADLDMAIGTTLTNDTKALLDATFPSTMTDLNTELLQLITDINLDLGASGTTTLNADMLALLSEMAVQNGNPSPTDMPKFYNAVVSDINTGASAAATLTTDLTTLLASLYNTNDNGIIQGALFSAFQNMITALQDSSSAAMTNQNSSMPLLLYAINNFPITELPLILIEMINGKAETASPASYLSGATGGNGVPILGTQVSFNFPNPMPSPLIVGPWSMYDVDLAKELSVAYANNTLLANTESPSQTTFKDLPGQYSGIHFPQIAIDYTEYKTAVLSGSINQTTPSPIVSNWCAGSVVQTKDAAGNITSNWQCDTPYSVPAMDAYFALLADYQIYSTVQGYFQTATPPQPPPGTGSWSQDITEYAMGLFILQILLGAGFATYKYFKEKAADKKKVAEAKEKAEGNESANRSGTAEAISTDKGTRAGQKVEAGTRAKEVEGGPTATDRAAGSKANAVENLVDEIRLGRIKGITYGQKVNEMTDELKTKLSSAMVEASGREVTAEEAMAQIAKAFEGKVDSAIEDILRDIKF